jgi:hypothetical protein
VQSVFAILVTNIAASKIDGNVDPALAFEKCARFCPKTPMESVLLTTRDAVFPRYTGVTRHSRDFKLVCSEIGSRWLLSVRKLTGRHGLNG